MKKTKPQDRSQGAVAHEQSDTQGLSNQVVDASAPGKIPELPTHPALYCWDINRKLEKLEKSYGDEQKKKPIEIERSSVGNPRGAAIFWRVERLEQYVEDTKGVYQKEIESGRFADTADLWAAVYAVKILPSVAAKINSLRWNLAHKIWVTGGDGPGERGTVEEAQRRLSRLRASLESELARAISRADTVSVEECGDTAANRVPKLRSPLKKAVYAYLLEHRDASDKEIKEWLRDTNPSVVPEEWDIDDTLPGKTFTKVRALIKASQRPTTGRVNHHNPPVIRGVTPVSR